jgi:hypothetical protein
MTPGSQRPAAGKPVAGLQCPAWYDVFEEPGYFFPAGVVETNVV